MTEGTKSLLFGCHQFVMHPLFIVLAWRKLYHRWPKPWQLVCIFLHDIGHLGKDYLTHYEQKKMHWQLGAKIANKLFGFKGMALISGHTNQSSRGNSNYHSQLFFADKYSRLISPRWWLQLSDKVEGFDKDRSLDAWLSMMHKNWESGCPKDSHQIYLEIKEAANGRKRIS